jgi:hypothetical protein
MAYPTVTFRPTDGPLGMQPIAEASSTKNHPVGMVVRGVDWGTDTLYGEAEFIYLRSNSGGTIAKGDLCCYSQTGLVVQTVANGSTSIGPCAIAMADVGVAQFGWYMIAGTGPVKAATVSANTLVYLTATSGQVDDLVSSGNQVDGAFFKGATSGGFATIHIDRPSVTTQVSQSTFATDSATLATAVTNITTLQGQTANFVTSNTVTGPTLTYTGAAAGTTVAYNNLANVGLYKITVPHAVWVAAAATQDLILLTLPAKAMITNIILDVTVAFAGLAGTITLKGGVSAGGVELLAEADVKTAIARFGLADAELGTSMVRAAAIGGGYTPSWTATTSVQCRLTSGTGDIGAAGVTNLSAGTAVFYITVLNRP